MSLRAISPVLAALVLLLIPSLASAQGGLLQSMQNFEARCTQCHGADAPESRAPSRVMLSEMTPDHVLEVLTTGSMQVNAQGLSDAAKRSLAEYITGRPVGAAASGAASAMKNQCTAKPIGNLLNGPSWNGWGNDAMNSRMQTAANAGLSADQVPKLALKWAFGFPNGSSAYAQPAVAGGRVFVGSDNGYVYSIDAATGCVYWSFAAFGGVRTAITLGAIKTATGTRYAAYFGDLKANVFAVDAETGEKIWSARADTHPFARVTGAPTLANGKLYVPLSSFEEGSG
ncbi:MAG: PQQ-binding-like beta-propeller repeat protein, partial [Acidobacteriota bacterium]